MAAALDVDVVMCDIKPMPNINPILAKFLREHPDRKDADWASLFGCSRTHFLGIRSGKADPSKALIERIADRTGGQVPILSWFAKSGDDSHRGAH